jgi:multiple sugar transport system ATP-binding protein
MVFQSYALYSHLTVYENLAYPLRVRKLAKSDIDRRVREVAATVQIGELLDRKPRELSGGQRQRVALGRAIIRRPAVFLMDEPLSNLDAKLRLHTRGELKRFQRELATTTIYVTHDQAEAMTLADRVAIMEKGVLQQVGPPKEVYRRPANVFVAGFLGSPPMNLLDVQATSVAGSPALAMAGVAVPVSDGLADRVGRLPNHAGEVTLGVRPEEVSLHRDGAPGRVAGDVFVVEDLGNERLVTLDIGGQFVVARTAADYPAEMGQPLWFGFDPDRAHLFDPATQRRLD